MITELTNRLRYYTRNEILGKNQHYVTTLQQAYKNVETGEIIWEDIPTVIEN